MYKIMTAGPTQVRENVRLARSLECTSPDLDKAFFDFYKETCEMLSKVTNTDNKALILGGEGILGLEAACASLTEPGDKVLIIDNGIFGKGFADFVKIYGGEPVLYTVDYRNPVDLDELETYLKEHHDYKYATVVHCDTPSGVCNDVEAISVLLDRYGIMTVTDTVAALFGEPLDLSKSKIDILCGGSQKALSVPPGLTIYGLVTGLFLRWKTERHRLPASMRISYCLRTIMKTWFSHILCRSVIFMVCVQDWKTILQMTRFTKDMRRLPRQREQR